MNDADDARLLFNKTTQIHIFSVLTTPIRIVHVFDEAQEATDTSQTATQRDN